VEESEGGRGAAEVIPPPSSNPAFSGLHLPFVGFTFTHNSRISGAVDLFATSGVSSAKVVGESGDKVSTGALEQKAPFVNVGKDESAKNSAGVCNSCPLLMLDCLLIAIDFLVFTCIHLFLQMPT
jgi:hypothetical protein